MAVFLYNGPYDFGDGTVGYALPGYVFRYSPPSSFHVVAEATLAPGLRAQIERDFLRTQFTANKYYQTPRAAWNTARFVVPGGDLYALEAFRVQRQIDGSPMFTEQEE